MPTTLRNSERERCFRPVAVRVPVVALCALALSGGCATTEPSSLFELPPESPAVKAMQSRRFETSDPTELLSASAAALQRQYALDRTVLANERTSAAWIRTGLGAMVAGLAIEHLLIEVYPSWIIRGLAVALIIFSAAAFLIGAWRYSHLGIKLGPLDVKTIPTLFTSAIGIGPALCSILAFVGIVLVDR